MEILPDGWLSEANIALVCIYIDIYILVVFIFGCFCGTLCFMFFFSSFIVYFME